MTDLAFVSTRPSLRIDGDERTALGEALSTMTVNQPLNGMAHAELTLTNWGQSEQGREPDFLFGDVALGSRLEILLGEESPATLFDGEITGIEERYGDGAPQLILLAQDRLHRLARQRHSRSFEDRSPDELVQEIAAEAGISADANVSSLRANWHQLNESNLAFLLRLLRPFDICLRLHQETLRARSEEPDPQPVALDAQDSALSVRLLADLNHQPTRARVLGFNPGDDAVVNGSAQSLQPAPTGTTAAATLGELGWDGEEIMPQPFPRSQAEAEAFARGQLQSRAKRFLSGDIRCQGEPQLRSGREIELSGVSERLRGIYQVVHCVHRFDGRTGYETHLRVERPDWTP